MPALRIQIREITAEQTIALRWPILRTGLPRQTAAFEGDDDPGTRHFGGYLGEELVGVASVYRAPLPEMPEAEEPRQLRGMAVLEKARGLHCGVALVRHCELDAGLGGST